MAGPEELIRSRANPLFRRLRSLKEKGGAGKLCLIEGPKLLEEALAAGLTVVEAAASPRLGRSERGARLLADLRARGVPLRLLDDRLLASLSEVETSQGILALARRPSFEESAMFRGQPLIVVAVGIQNPGNLGGLLRTAEAAAATGAYLTEGTADPLSWKALRGSMGSGFRLPHRRGLGLAAVRERLTARGLAVVATTATGGARYDEVDLARPLAVLLGGEGGGLPPEVLAAADVRITIPMAPTVESLNVGVAAGILLFEAARQRRREGLVSRGDRLKA